MIKRIVIFAIGLTAFRAQADLIAGWDFQTTTSGGTAVAAAPGTPTSFTANVGVGTLSLNGTNGSSSWVQANELSAFGGTAVNAGPGMSTTTATPAALALLGGTGFSANGKFLTLAFSMFGYEDLVLSYATQRSGTGFTSQVWEYSTDGSTWNAVTSFISIPSSFATQTTPVITGLNNQPTSFLRLTVTGATNTTGNNRLDNFQLNANVVPEPATAGLLALGMLVLRRVRRR